MAKKQTSSWTGFMLMKITRGKKTVMGDGVRRFDIRRQVKSMYCEVL